MIGALTLFDADWDQSNTITTGYNYYPTACTADFLDWSGWPVLTDRHSLREIRRRYWEWLHSILGGERFASPTRIAPRCVRSVARVTRWGRALRVVHLHQAVRKIRRLFGCRNRLKISTLRAMSAGLRGKLAQKTT